MKLRSAYASALLVLLLAGPAAAQQTAAQWADQEKETLAAITPASLAETLKQGAPALDALFAQIKTAGQSDAVASVRIAALTQHVMRPENARGRKSYADALLAAAQRATETDVTCFFLDQLRWCGLPHQASAIKAFEKSGDASVAPLATITLLAVTDDRASKATPPAPTRNATLNRQLAALKDAPRMAAILKAADDPDTAYAGVALAWAATTGGKAETKVWGAKLMTASDPVRKAMLLDMLARRGDKTACEAVSACLADSDDTVAAAAQRALLILDPAALAARTPDLLKALPPERHTLVRDTLRQLSSGQLKTLVAPYDTFSPAGKKVALELFKERRLAETLPLGLAALDAADEETAIGAYRLLREIAGKEQAENLLAKLPSASGRVLPEAQTTFAAAARRDATGTYLHVLTRAIENAEAKQKTVLLETAGRVGGDALLKVAEGAAASDNADVSTAAVRALADWADNASLPLLMRLAVTAPDARRQTLALRGLTKKLEAKNLDKQPFAAAWQTIRPAAGTGNEEHKTAIDALLKK